MEGNIKVILVIYCRGKEMVSNLYLIGWNLDVIHIRVYFKGMTIFLFGWRIYFSLLWIMVLLREKKRYIR